MKLTIFWDIKLRSPLKAILRFGETYSFHVQGRRTSRADLLFIKVFAYVRNTALKCTEIIQSETELWRSLLILKLHYFLKQLKSLKVMASAQQNKH
jgi:hypothetical protein